MEKLEGQKGFETWWKEQTFFILPLPLSNLDKLLISLSVTFLDSLVYKIGIINSAL